jgi:hypothetical protein
VDPLPEHVNVVDLPPYVESWSVAKIPGFITGVLNRWQREYGELPHEFVIVMCPKVEINAKGGLPPRIYELTDPQLRCRHFTGCHRPYLVIIFTDEDAEKHRAEVQTLLSWSESYRVELADDRVHLRFAEAVEDLDNEPVSTKPTRKLRELLQTGDLVSILD